MRLCSFFYRFCLFIPPFFTAFVSISVLNLARATFLMMGSKVIRLTGPNFFTFIFARLVKPNRLFCLIYIFVFLFYLLFRFCWRLQLLILYCIISFLYFYKFYTKGFILDYFRR